MVRIPNTKKIPPNRASRRSGKASSSNIDLRLLFHRYVVRPSVAAGMRSATERHFRRLPSFGFLRFIQLEHLRRGKTERVRDQHSGKLLDRNVVLGDGVVQEAARRGDLVFQIAQLVLQLPEVLVRLELR